MNLRLESCLVGAAALAASLLFPACDNPACVFGGTCTGVGGGGGGVVATNAATVPVDHNWLSNGAPTITGFFPSGAASTISKDTPIVVVFSESMAASRLSNTTIQLFQDLQLSIPAPIYPPTLSGDGRVLLVMPIQSLALDTPYKLIIAPNEVIHDLQGTELVPPADGVIGRFTTAATNPATPKVVMTFPFDNSSNQSATGEFVAVFDRRINAATMSVDSFAVTVGGVTPANNPTPQPLTILVAGVPTVDTRAWRYRSVGAGGVATEFPPSTQVQVTMSPSAHRILASDASTVPTTIADYTTAPFGAPHAVELVSTPLDAINIENLDGTNPLQVGLQLVNAQANDRLGIFIVGKSTVVPTPPAQAQDIALYRERRLGDIASFDVALQTVTIGEAELDLASGSSQIAGRVADGSISIGVTVKRGLISSPVRMLDTDTTTTGVQAARIDTVRPTFAGFGTSGSNMTSLTGDLRDLSVIGRASEKLRIAEVTSALGNNGAMAEVIASDSTGLFVAQPIAVGLLDPAQMPLAFSMTLYDQAMNRAVGTVNGNFTQVGAVGPGAALPGNATIDVEVVDDRSLAPIANAKVFVHEDNGGVFTLVDNDVTSAAGKATLTAAATGETIVTVDAANYDLFTFHGAPTSRISIPLNRTGTVNASVQGSLATTSIDLPLFDRFGADSRTSDSSEPVITVQSCTPNAALTAFTCGIGPASVRPSTIGAQSFVGVEPPISAFAFVATAFLRSYALQMPLPAINPNQSGPFNLTVNSMLDDAGVDQEERALDGPAALLDATAVNGVDLNDLNGEPRVEVQAIVPGIRGAVLAGFGAALDGQGSPHSIWAVRSAIPGVCDPTSGKYAGDTMGELVLNGTIDPDLFLRCELRDNNGNRAGRRARFSVGPAVVAPMSVPLVSSPAALSTVPGPEYDVVFDNVIPGGGQDGLYRVRLITSAGGRGWTLYRLDAAGASHSVHLPDILAAGGSPLSAGTISCTVGAFAWPSFDRTLFSFTDVEREQDLFAEAASFDFSQL